MQAAPFPREERRRAGLCLLVGLADGLASVHHHWLVCAFAGGNPGLRDRLAHVVKRGLTVHGNWEEEEQMEVKLNVYLRL